jgi:hypothetical protein
VPAGHLAECVEAGQQSETEPRADNRQVSAPRQVLGLPTTETRYQRPGFRHFSEVSQNRRLVTVALLIWPTPRKDSCDRIRLFLWT